MDFIADAHALTYVNARCGWSRYYEQMRTQNYASTATYFERRAAKVASGRRRARLEAAAAHYRSLAGESGQYCAPAPRASNSEVPIPPRRKRLMELFRVYGNAPA